MTRSTLLATVLTASVALGGVAYAADQATAPVNPPPTAIQKDVGKLSADGAQAFRDFHLARVAIFDADPAKAKTLLGQAQTALGKAKADESVFMKAEADFKTPATAKAPAAAAKPSADAGKADMPATGGGDTAKPVAWLPVDGQLTLGEDFVATPQKAAAVADANKSLAKSDQKGALEKLRLADIDVNFTMAVLPLNQTVSNIDQAAKLLDQGKYYEANAVLKQTEDSMRFDVIDTTAAPQKAAQSATTSPAGTAKPAAH